MSQPSEQDLQAPYDPTGYAQITGAQLLQLINGATTADDKGIIITTIDDISGNPQVPDVNTVPQWNRYFWRRVSATSVGVYVWNPSIASDVTFLNWQSINVAGIAVGSIVNNMIADNTIQAQKIVSITYSQITGAPSGLPPSGAAGGVLTGTYPNPSIGNGNLITAMYAALSVDTAALKDLNVTVGKLAPVSGSYKDMARVNVGATGMESFTPPVLFTSGVVVPAANALKIPQVNAGATDFQMVATTTLGRVLQRTTATTANPYASAVAVAAGVITGADGTDVADLKITNFVPISAASRIRITVRGVVSKITNAGYCILAVYKVATGTTIDGAVNAAGANAVHLATDATHTSEVTTVYEVASGAVTGIDIAIRILASSNGNVTFNPTTGYTPTSLGSIEVIEYI